MHMKIFLILITSSLIWADHHVPVKSEEKNNNPYIITRFFKKLSAEHSLVSTFEYRKDNDRNVIQGEFSFRRNISRFVQYGLDADISKGHRHDSDWVKETGDDWKWQDGEAEFGSSLFLKLKRDFYISDKSFSASANIKTHNNWTKTLLTLKPEFVLTYHHFSEGLHKFNIYLKNKIYIPFNYSDEDIYATWYYLGILFNYERNLKPFIFYAYKKQTWTPTDDFKKDHQAQSDQYKSESTLTYIGVGLNYYF